MAGSTELKAGVVQILFPCEDENDLETIYKYAKAAASGVVGNLEPALKLAAEKLLVELVSNAISQGKIGMWARRGCELLVHEGGGVPEKERRFLTLQLNRYRAYGMCEIPTKLYLTNPYKPPKEWPCFSFHAYLLAPSTSEGELMIRWRWPWEKHMSEHLTGLRVRKGKWWELPGYRGATLDEGVLDLADEERGVRFEVASVGGGIVQVWKGDKKLADTSEPPYRRFKGVWVLGGATVTLKAISLDSNHDFEYWLYNGMPVPRDAKHDVEIWGAGNQFIATFFRKKI